jgi:hypothetical protein
MHYNGRFQGKQGRKLQMMNKHRVSSRGCVSLAIAIAVCCTQLKADTYPGNGGTSFGGPLGAGSIILTHSGTTISETFTRGSGNHNDILVLYIDSVAGGSSTTSGFNDQPASYTFDFNWSEIGLNNPGSFNWVATYVSESGFRSNEAIGASDASGGNIGSGTLNHSSFVTSPVPEPSSAALLGIGATALLVLRRIRK